MAGGIISGIWYFEILLTFKVPPGFSARTLKTENLVVKNTPDAVAVS
jgi:hypothetical protein